MLPSQMRYLISLIKEDGCPTGFLRCSCLIQHLGRRMCSQLFRECSLALPDTEEEVAAHAFTEALEEASFLGIGLE